jgi:hypothetical protein
MIKDKYTLSIEEMGERSAWKDSKLPIYYGSTDNYVKLEDVSILE